jgi:hypothetical protein
LGSGGFEKKTMDQYANENHNFLGDGESIRHAFMKEMRISLSGLSIEFFSKSVAVWDP